MPRTTLILILLIIILLIGGGIYNTIQESPKSSQKNYTNTKTNNSSNQTQEINTSLKSLIEMNKSLKCTFTLSIQGFSVDGTIYTSKGKAKADAQSGPPLSIVAYLIIDSQKGFLWIEGADNGISFPANDESLTGKNNEIPDINKKISFLCLPWVPDTSLFIPPSNMPFKTISSPSASPSSYVK